MYVDLDINQAFTSLELAKASIVETFSIVEAQIDFAEKRRYVDVQVFAQNERITKLVVHNHVEHL